MTGEIDRLKNANVPYGSGTPRNPTLPEIGKAQDDFCDWLFTDYKIAIRPNIPTASSRRTRRRKGGLEEEKSNLSIINEKVKKQESL